MLIFEIITTIYFTFYIKQIPMLNYPGGIVKTFSDIAMIPSFCVRNTKCQNTTGKGS